MNKSHPLHPSLSDLSEVLPQILWAARPDGAVDWANREFERYTGMTDIDLEVGGWLLALHPDDRAGALSEWEAARERGLAYRTEFRLWCSMLECWRWHLVDARPHRDEAGNIIRWYGIAIDAQEIRDAQETRDTELRLQTVERRTLERISKGDTLEQILKGICLVMGDMLNGALSTVALISEDGTHLDACHGVDALDDWARTIGQIPVGEGQGACGTAVFRRAPVFSNDIAQDPLWAAYAKIASEHELAACWSLPILDASGQPIASFACYYSTPRAPDDAQVALLHRIAALISNAISQVGSRDRLAASEQRYRTLFDFLPIAIWEEDISETLALLDTLKQAGVTDLNAWLDENPSFIDRALASIRVQEVNRAARSLHGIGEKDCATLSQSLARHADEPKFRDAVRKMLVAAWVGARDITVSSAILKPDGTKSDLLVQMLLPAENCGRLLVTELDVTEQHRAEERFRHVAQASSDYIFDRDFETETTWVNDGASWHPDLPAGPSVVPRGAWVDSVHPEDNARVLRGIEGAIQGGAAFWEGEYRLRMRSGDYIPVRERASILRNDAGAPVRMIGNIVDLSEQKALEAQLRQSQRLDAIGQLTGGIAHDFNNLLTVILGNADTLVETLPADQRTAAMAKQIVGAAERAAELTQRLLAFARKQPLAPGVHDAAAIVEDMRMLFERSLTPAIALELDVAPSTGRVHVDRALFESALLNLCLNARDAMPDGGVLRIEAGPFAPAGDADTQRSGNLVRIAVSDTGTGMDEETRLRVFEPFFTTKPPGEGNGLGLSMVYGFVQQSGGDVRIDSKPGIGTTIELLLPVHDLNTEDDATPAATPAAGQTKFRGRILVVDDNAQVRDYTCLLVRSLGFDVVDEPDAASALDRLRTGGAFDLVLSDVVMPGGTSGRQLAETVLDEWPGLPVLLVSGHSDDISGADKPLSPKIAFLRKPFRKHDLADRLARMLPRH